MIIVTTSRLMRDIFIDCWSVGWSVLSENNVMAATLLINLIQQIN
jgi:hypothetical protein